MRMVHVVSALLVLWAASPVHSEPVAPFVIAGDNPTDLDPTPFGEALATQGPLVFVGGSTIDSETGLNKAVLAAFRIADRDEVWRAFGSPLVRSYSTVAAGHGKVCAAGSWSRGLWVDCYRASTGRLLWERRLEILPFSFAQPALQMQIASRSVVLSYTATARSRVTQSLVLSFDARDGS